MNKSFHYIMGAGIPHTHRDVEKVCGGTYLKSLEKWIENIRIVNIQKKKFQ